MTSHIQLNVADITFFVFTLFVPVHLLACIL